MMKNKPFIILCCIFISCVWWDEKNSGSDKELIFQILPQLSQNTGGYFIMPIGSSQLPVSHRVYAYIGTRDYNTFEYEDLTQTTVTWHSNMYTLDGDTVGYYRKRRFVDNSWTYIHGDTLTIYTGDTTRFRPMLSPITTTSNDSGIVSTILKISPQIFKDTLILEAATLDQFDDCPLDSCFVAVPILISK